MKQAIFRADVEEAIESLKRAGKSPTIKAIHGALGGRGSTTTLLRLKAEIDAEATALRDSQEALRIFREFWKLAVQEGRSQKDAEVEGMRETIDALASELQTLETASVTASQSLCEVSRQRDSLVEELTKLHHELAAARTNLEQYSQKLGDAGERIVKLDAEAADLKRQLGTREAELVRTNEQAEEARARADRFSADLAEALGKIERLRASHEEDTKRLNAQLSAERERAHRLEIGLAKAETWMESKRTPPTKIAMVRKHTKGSHGPDGPEGDAG